jgi:hypothetical protein
VHVDSNFFNLNSYGEMRGARAISRKGATRPCGGMGATTCNVGARKVVRVCWLPRAYHRQAGFTHTQPGRRVRQVPADATIQLVGGYDRGYLLALSLDEAYPNANPEPYQRPRECATQQLEAKQQRAYAVRLSRRCR